MTCSDYSVAERRYEDGVDDLFPEERPDPEREDELEHDFIREKHELEEK